MRHGETESNLNKLLTGRQNVPLNKKGDAQAHNAGELLKNEQFDYFFCSPLKRAKETAQVINKHHNLKINISDNIVERDFGELTGVSHDRVNRDILWNYYECEKLYPNTENIKDMFARIYSFIEELKQKYSGKKILVVAHSGVYRGFYCYKHGVPEDGRLLSVRPDNASITVFEY